MIERTHPRIWAAIAILAICVGSIASSGPNRVYANGNANPVVRNEQAGPYEVQVGMFPGNPQIGNLHLSITLVDAEAGSIITDAVVTVASRGPEGVPGPGPVQAAITSVDPQSYEADITLGRRGFWVLTLDMDSHLGKEDLDFTVNVSASRGLNWAYGLAGPIVIVLFGTWAWRRARGPRIGPRV